MVWVYCVLLKIKGFIQTDDHKWLEIEEHRHIENHPELVYHSLYIARAYSVFEFDVTAMFGEVEMGLFEDNLLQFIAY